MDEILDFASLLMKLVLILLVALMAATLAVAPDTMVENALSALALVAPLFVLTTVLDLAGALRRSQEDGFALKSPRDFSHGS